MQQPSTHIAGILLLHVGVLAGCSALDTQPVDAGHWEVQIPTGFDPPPGFAAGVTPEGCAEARTSISHATLMWSSLEKNPKGVVLVMRCTTRTMMDTQEARAAAVASELSTGHTVLGELFGPSMSDVDVVDHPSCPYAARTTHESEGLSAHTLWCADDTSVSAVTASVSGRVRGGPTVDHVLKSFRLTKPVGLSSAARLIEEFKSKELSFEEKPGSIFLIQGGRNPLATLKKLGTTRVFRFESDSRSSQLGVNAERQSGWPAALLGERLEPLLATDADVQSINLMIGERQLKGIVQLSDSADAAVLNKLSLVQLQETPQGYAILLGR